VRLSAPPRGAVSPAPALSAAEGSSRPSRARSGGTAGFQQLVEQRTDLSFRTAEEGEESAFSLAFSEMQMPRSARHDS